MRWVLSRLFRFLSRQSAEERRVATRCGLVCQRSGNITVVSDKLIGTLLLSNGSRKVFIHRSSKKNGIWQASFFNGDTVLKDQEYPSVQEALDSIRLQGFVLRSLMQTNGILLL